MQYWGDRPSGPQGQHCQFRPVAMEPCLRKELLKGLRGLLLGLQLEAAGLVLEQVVNSYPLLDLLWADCRLFLRHLPKFSP